MFYSSYEYSYKLRRELRDKERHLQNLIKAIADRGHSKALLDALHKAELAEASLRLEVHEIEKGLQPPRIYDRIQMSTIANEIKDALRGDDIHQKKLAIHMLTSRIIASRSNSQVNGVLYSSLGEGL